MTNTDKPLIDGQWQPSEWNGIPQLTCIHCKWDTLEGIEAARAYKATCARCNPPVPDPLPPPTILVANKWGDSIYEESE